VLGVLPGGYSFISAEVWVRRRICQKAEIRLFYVQFMQICSTVAPFFLHPESPGQVDAGNPVPGGFEHLFTPAPRVKAPVDSDPMPVQGEHFTRHVHPEESGGRFYCGRYTEVAGWGEADFLRRVNRQGQVGLSGRFFSLISRS